MPDSRCGGMPAAVRPQAAPPRPESLTPAQRARRDRIVATAVELLGREEYERIQMRDVAEQASVSLGTVYRYFVSKEHLFAAAVVAWAGGLGRRLEQRPPGGRSNAERMEHLLQRALHAFELQPQYYRAIMVLQVSSDPFAGELYEQLAEGILQTLSTVVDGLSAEDTKRVVQVCGAVLDVYLRAWLLGRESIGTVSARLSAAVHTIFEFSDPGPMTDPPWPAAAPRAAGGG